MTIRHACLLISLQGALELGAASTLSHLIEELQRGASSEDTAWRHMAAHLLRIAGAQPCSMFSE